MKKNLIICLFILTTISLFGNVFITEKSFLINLSRPKTQEFDLINNGTSPVRVQISTRKPSDLKDDDSYLGEYIKIYPSMVVIPAKGKRKVRFAVRAPKSLKDGEYRAILFYKTLLSDKEKKNLVNESSIRFSIETGVQIFGRKGQFKTGLKVLNKKIKTTPKNVIVSADLSNNGNFSTNFYVTTILYSGSRKLGSSKPQKIGIFKNGVETFKFEASKNKIKNKVTSAVLNIVSDDKKFKRAYVIK